MQTRQRSAKDKLLQSATEEMHLCQKVRKPVSFTAAAEPMRTRQRSRNEESSQCLKNSASGEASPLEKENSPETISESGRSGEDPVCRDSASGNSIGASVNLPFEAQSWLEVRKRLETIVWIQCDNPHCMKWRKVEKEEICGFGKEDKWFCKLNKDPDFKSCDVPEEDTDFYDKLADRAGLKYIKSELVPGALVWARMTGYCSWPAVVTADPASDYGHLDRDAERAEIITHYHVEFLGRPHTHGWVYAKDVHVFTADSVNKQMCAGENTEKKSKQKTKCWKEKKNTGKGTSLEHAVSEALTLLPSSPDKRLKRCVYQLQETLVSQHEKNSGSAAKHTVTAFNISYEARKDHRSPNTSFTSFDSALADKTKEERLMLDVEMYKRNERAFEHDVSRFMIRNGVKPCKGPLWQNRRISLFQLFLAVHERGGYEWVTKKRWWAAVYRELTETPTHDASSSNLPKLFYQRHLYPYELFVRGRNYENMLHKNARETQGHHRERKALASLNGKSDAEKIERHRPSETEARHNGEVIEGPQATEVKTEQQKGTKTKAKEDEEEEDDDVKSGSLEDMLRALEDNNFLCKAYLEDVSGQDREIDVTFYDESTPETKGKLTLADFEDPPVPATEASATIAPPSEEAGEHETSSSSEGSLLHQLEVLQEGMDFIQDHIDLS